MSDYLYSIEHRLKPATEDARRLSVENAALIAERIDGGVRVEEHKSHLGGLVLITPATFLPHRMLS